MYTVAEIVARCNALPQVWYGQYGDSDGFWVIDHNRLYWREDDGAQVEVDLNEFRAHGVKLGRVDLADAQRMQDGNRVQRCSRTVSAVA